MTVVPCIAVDIDNVVLEFQKHWAGLHDNWFGTELLIDHLRSEVNAFLRGYEVEDPLAKWDAITTKSRFDNGRDFFRWFNKADGWKTMPTIPGALGACWRLNELGVPWFFCTARPGAGMQPAEKLAKKFNVPVEFLSAADKWTIGADWYIDDSAVVLDNVRTKGRNLNGAQAIRIRKPWNDHLGPHDIACDTLADAVTYLETEVLS